MATSASPEPMWPVLAAAFAASAAMVHGLRTRLAKRQASTPPAPTVLQHIAEAVQDAAVVVPSHVLRTPVVLSPALSTLAGADSSGRPAKVFLKLESEQVTGSFKARGAVNKVLQLSARSARLPFVTTASTGNHALAVTYALKTLAPGADFCIYLPSNASAAKVSALRAQGARLCLVEADDCERAEVAAREAAAAAGGEFISPYNDLEVAAGQGTIAVELLQQVQDLHVVFVPVGGGGMIAGIASHLKAVAPHVKVVGCQPASNACMHASLQAGRVLGEGEFANGATWSDGTAGGIEAGSLTFAACAEGVDEWVLVSEAAIAEAMQDFMAEQHKIIEGSAGVALAAFRARAADFAGCNAAVVCCGANLPLDKVAMLAQAAASKAH